MHTIKTPSVFTLDPKRYHVVNAVQPVQTPEGLTGSLEVTVDYDLLAADLDVMGWPDELTEAITALGSKPSSRESMSFREGDYFGGERTDLSQTRDDEPTQDPDSRDPRDEDDYPEA